MIARLRALILAEAVKNFLLQRQLCVLTLIRCPFHPPVLPQWHIKDPGHSVQSAGGTLHLNTNILHSMKYEWADYTVQAKCSNLSGKQAHSGLSSLSHCGLILAWTVELVPASWSPLKKMQARTDSLNLLPSSLHASHNHFSPSSRDLGPCRHLSRGNLVLHTSLNTPTLYRAASKDTHQNLRDFVDIFASHVYAIDIQYLIPFMQQTWSKYKKHVC